MHLWAKYLRKLLKNFEHIIFFIFFPGGNIVFGCHQARLPPGFQRPNVPETVGNPF